MQNKTQKQIHNTKINLSNTTTHLHAQLWSVLTSSFEQDFMLVSCGIVLVTTTFSKFELFIREIAGPDKIPWEQIA